MYDNQNIITSQFETIWVKIIRALCNFPIYLHSFSHNTSIPVLTFRSSPKGCESQRDSLVDPLSRKGHVARLYFICCSLSLTRQDFPFNLATEFFHLLISLRCWFNLSVRSHWLFEGSEACCDITRSHWRPFNPEERKTSNFAYDDNVSTIRLCHVEQPVRRNSTSPTKKKEFLLRNLAEFDQSKRNGSNGLLRRERKEKNSFRDTMGIYVAMSLTKRRIKSRVKSLQ